MEEIKDIAYYTVMSYLSLGITYAAARDLYYFASIKIKNYKEKKNLEAKLIKDEEKIKQEQSKMNCFLRR